MKVSSINNNIKSIRELRNYTQEYVAGELGMTQAGYSKIEIGKTRVSYEKLEEIACLLKVSVQDIINFDTQNCFKNTNENYTGSISLNSQNCDTVIQKLYKDKIMLLELLLRRTDKELERYREKYGLL